jgi:hypothetical protein
MNLISRYLLLALMSAVVLVCRGKETTGNAKGLYRKIRPTDLCLEREVFTGPSKDKLAGRLSEESTAYRESLEEQPRSAIRFSIWVSGRRLDIWREKEVVMQWYVLKDKRYAQCSWIASPEEMLFGPNDVWASTPIEQTGPGQWRARPGKQGGLTKEKNTRNFKEFGVTPSFLGANDGRRSDPERHSGSKPVSVDPVG